MQVKFTTPVVGKGFVYGDGKVYDLPVAEAKYWIRIGYARAVEEKQPVQRPLKVQQVKAKRQPIKPKR